MVEQEDGILWSWQVSLDRIGIKICSQFLVSLREIVEVVSSSYLEKDLRHGGMNEEECKGSKGPWNGSKTSWK